MDTGLGAHLGELGHVSQVAREAEHTSHIRFGADGLLMHALNSVTYSRDVMLPALAQGLQKSGRTRREFTLRGTVFPVLGATDEAFELARVRLCVSALRFASSAPRMNSGPSCASALMGWWIDCS